MEEKKFSFAAIDINVVDNIPVYKEAEIKGKEMVACGEDNRYPSFLYDISTNSPTLSSIIRGMLNYITGEGVKCNIPGFQENIEEIIDPVLDDYLRIGYCAIEVLRKNNGDIDSLNWLDARMVRSDKNNEGFWYSPDFVKSTNYVRNNKAIFLPKFKREHRDIARSIIFIKTPQSRGVYGNPMYFSALKDAVVEGKIADFHLNELCNNFTASAIINFRSGIPTDEEKAKIEKEIKRKFGGTENAGRFLLSFSEGSDNSTTIERLNTDDFADRYNALLKKTRETIFVSMGAFPILFAQDYESKGFSDSDFKESFKIYNKTIILPIQRRFSMVFDKLFGVSGSVTFNPYNIDWGEDTEDTKVTDGVEVEVGEA